MSTVLHRHPPQPGGRSRSRLALEQPWGDDEIVRDTLRGCYRDARQGMHMSPLEARRYAIGALVLLLPSSRSHPLRTVEELVAGPRAEGKGRPARRP